MPACRRGRLNSGNGHFILYWFYFQNKIQQGSDLECPTIYNRISAYMQVVKFYTLSLLGVRRAERTILITALSTLRYFPVLPNPPAPRSVSDKTATSEKVICSYFATTICAIRSPGSMVCASFDRLTMMMPISPR